METNETAWNSIFEDFHVLEQIKNNIVFQISAKQIAAYREPRLMAKFDHENNLPSIFQKNKLAILPITRGDYIISRFSAYHQFEKNESQPTYFSVPNYLESLSRNNIKSETIAINYAAASGILADFLQEKTIIPTVSGRMGSGSFQFMIKHKNNNSKYSVLVNNSQIEIDAAYEGQNFLALLEAKRDLSADFLVRQLYYPYRTWAQKIKKTIRPVFLIYSNGIYHLYEYKFLEQELYNSIELVQQKKYSIDETKISYSDIESILMKVSIIEDPIDIPFPQADDFSRIINLCELLNEQSLNKHEITEQYDFTERQTDYYVNAVRYLGLVDISSTACRLTLAGKDLFMMGFKKRQLTFCKAILSHNIFNFCFRKYIEQNRNIDKTSFIPIMKEMHLTGVNSNETYYRRSKTILAWIKWIDRLYQN